MTLPKQFYLNFTCLDFLFLFSLNQILQMSSETKTILKWQYLNSKNGATSGPVKHAQLKKFREIVKQDLFFKTLTDVSQLGPFGFTFKDVRVKSVAQLKLHITKLFDHVFNYQQQQYG